MASFDPFEKEFGNRARGLRRTPSTQSWNQLEQRLDRRRRGIRILGIRPWMIAAMFLIIAGITIASNLKQDHNNPLAKRAEFMEELSAPYVPTEVFEPGEYENGLSDAYRILIKSKGDAYPYFMLFSLPHVRDSGVKRSLR
jgi:hypothetical protein